MAFLGTGVAWLVAAAAAGAVTAAGGGYGWRWLALHFAFVGGISQMVLGAAQFFVCAFLATEPPRRKTVRAQLAVWNAGTVLVAVGVRADVTALSGTGGTLLLIGLCLFAHSLRAMERRSLQSAPWAARWYLAAAAALAIGATLGPIIAAGTRWTHGSLLAAHMVLNLGGWFGTAIVGTVHTFYPSLTATRLRHPRLQPITFASWTIGIATLAAAAAFNSQPAAIAGWALLLAAATALLVNVAASARSAERHPAAALLVGGGQVLMGAAAVAGLVLTAQSGATAAQLGSGRVVLALLAVGGWIGLTVAGSLLHLLALMARVRRLDRPSAPARERLPLAGAAAVVAGVAAGVVAHAAGIGALATVAGVVIAAGYVALGGRVAALALRALSASPLRV